MALLGNLIWFFTGGILVSIFYFIGAILFFPMFVPLARLAIYSAWPFGKGVVSKSELEAYRKISGNDYEESKAAKALQTTSGVMNLIWLFTFGWLLGAVHFFAALVNLCLFFMIVTIPNIVANWRLVGVAFMPFNKVVVPKEIADQIRITLAKNKLKI